MKILILTLLTLGILSTAHAMPRIIDDGVSAPMTEGLKRPLSICNEAFGAGYDGTAKSRAIGSLLEKCHMLSGNAAINNLNREKLSRELNGLISSSGGDIDILGSGLNALLKDYGLTK